MPSRPAPSSLLILPSLAASPLLTILQILHRLLIPHSIRFLKYFDPLHLGLEVEPFKVCLKIQQPLLILRLRHLPLPHLLQLLRLGFRELDVREGGDAAAPEVEVPEDELQGRQYRNRTEEALEAYQEVFGVEAE